MSPLSTEQKVLIFDYSMGLASPGQSVEARALISSNPHAAELHAALQATLSPLDSVDVEVCPDDLTERTILRLNDAASTSANRLQELLADEQERFVRSQRWTWLGAARRLATAAVFLIAGSVLFAAFNYFRWDSYRQQCQIQQSGFYQALGNYVRDHDGSQPAVATQVGEPWYKLGYQGAENHSNTRRVFLLLKEGYIKRPDSFVCPSCRMSRGRPELTAAEIRSYKDFPDRRYITYSVQIRCRQGSDGQLHCRKVLMADLSPLFETLPDPADFGKPFSLHLNRTLLRLNSINHNRKGQNILFGDGHTEFLRHRLIGVANDDVFTLQNTDVYHGCEVPDCETDFFLAP